MRKINGWIGAALVGGASVAVLQAGEPTLSELDQKVKVLERKLEIADEAAAAKAKDAVSVKAGKDGFSINSADKAFQLKIRGYVQADGRFYLDDKDHKATDSFLLRRVRPVFEGKIYEDFGFKIMPDFGDGKTVLYDAYGEYTPRPEFGIRVGKFKLPVGLERLQSARDLEFVERGLPTDLVPNRDIGVQLGGEFGGGTLQYQAGIFNGVPDGGNADADTNDGKDLAARLFLHPFRLTDVEALKNFGVGVAASVGDQTGTPSSPNLPTFKSVGQQTFFSYKNSTNANGIAYADGQLARLIPQAYYYVGPFGLLGEYVQSQQDVTDGKNKDTLDNTAWQIQGSWVLTGEDATYTGVTPLHNFEPSTGHIGAVELVARIQDLTVDDGALSAKLADGKKSANEAKGWGVGLNWYLNKNVKFNLDYDQTAFTGGAPNRADRPDEKVILARTQFAF